MITNVNRNKSDCTLLSRYVITYYARHHNKSAIKETIALFLYGHLYGESMIVYGNSPRLLNGVTNF